MKTLITANNAGTVTQQFNANHLTTERAPIIGQGWEDIEIDEDFFYESIDQIVNLIGGQAKTMQKIRYTLRSQKFNHWSADRFIWSNSRKRWEYCAGQDQPLEMKEIRKYLTK